MHVYRAGLVESQGVLFVVHLGSRQYLHAVPPDQKIQCVKEWRRNGVVTVTGHGRNAFKSSIVLKYTPRC